MRRAFCFCSVTLYSVLLCAAAFAQDVQVNPVDTNLPNQDNSTAQSETSHAVFGSTIVAAYNDSTQTTSLGFSLTSLMSFAYSTNGGVNWNYGGLVAPPAGKQILGDPMVTVDSSGNFYMASLIGPGGFAISASPSTAPPRPARPWCLVLPWS